MSQHNYTLISTVVFSLLALFWETKSPVNALIKLAFGVLGLTGLFVLLGIS